jgi:hypothetical protein
VSRSPDRTAHVTCVHHDHEASTSTGDNEGYSLAEEHRTCSASRNDMSRRDMLAHLSLKEFSRGRHRLRARDRPGGRGTGKRNRTFTGKTRVGAAELDTGHSRMEGLDGRLRVMSIGLEFDGLRGISALGMRSFAFNYGHAGV